MSLSPKDFSFDFPESLIALYPSEKRESSRLLVLNKSDGSIEHQFFFNVMDYLGKGDVLVFNNSKVFPCRLMTQRKTGGRQEIFLLRRCSVVLPEKKELWRVMLNANRKVRDSDQFEFEGLKITIQGEQGSEREALLEFDGDLFKLLDQIADIPLPPYIHRATESLDQNRYQTVYAKKTGSVAAPTAGLHFTESLLNGLKEKGVILAEITLHVGPGTFLPVRSEKIQDHKMHTEFFSISQECCDVINLAKKEGRRVTSVGTTSTRVLETLARKKNHLEAQSGETDIFIYPHFEFKIVDQMITNFHQPESTLMMLVSAFAGRDKILNAYHEAIQSEYRLFSYGDAMLIR